MAGIYLHIPYCTQRCIYCDFYFVTNQSSRPAFVKALCAEIEMYSQTQGNSTDSSPIGKETINTVYLGGGTPSVLILDDLAAIFNTLNQHFDINPEAEITLEANPEDLTREYLTGLKSIGINRLSIGVQSFYDDDLAFMGRSHSASQALEVLENVKKTGFDQYSIDLIFGIPDQRSQRWSANLEKLFAAGVPHISTYGLTVEPKTVLSNLVDRGRVTPTDDDLMNEHYLFTSNYLRDRSYDHYEISSFALPGARSKHNQIYWNHTNYLGFGPGAHAFAWKNPQRTQAKRWSNIKNIKKYIDLIGKGTLPIEYEEHLLPNELADEYIMLRLRTSDGLNIDTLENDYGVDLLTEKVSALAKLESEKLVIRMHNNIICLTDKGRLLCNSVTGMLID